MAALHSLSPPTAHRDLKPQNILVHWDEVDFAESMMSAGDDGLMSVGGGSWRPLVCDFGMSKSLEATLDRPTRSILNQTGALVGTPLYIAPEVLRGERHSLLSDVYSFAITLADVCHHAADGRGLQVSHNEIRTFFFDVKFGRRPDSALVRMRLKLPPSVIQLHVCAAVLLLLYCCC